MIRGKLILYQDKATEWRWRLIAGNGRILTVSSESYSSLAALKKGLQRTTELFVAFQSQMQINQLEVGLVNFLRMEAK